MKPENQHKRNTIFAAFAILLSILAVTGCASNKPGEVEINGNGRQTNAYTQAIERNVLKLSAEKRKERDSVYQFHTKSALYKRLYLEKITDAEYISLVGEIGYVLLNRRDSTFTLHLKQLKGPLTAKDTFLCCIAYLDFRGGYIPEFQELVSRYVKKYGYYFGEKNNLCYARLYVEPLDKDALDALGQNCKDWSEKPKSYDGNYFLHPQFVFFDEYVNYLKVYYPNSKYIPPPPPPIEILKKSAKYEDLMSGYYVYCTIKNNTSNLIKYLDVTAVFYDGNQKVVGTGIGNTLNIASGAQRTITILAPNIEGESSYDIEMGNAVY